MNSNDPRIVLVEDDEDEREMLGVLLGSLGFRVEVTKDGPSGLAAIVELAPRFALIDIGLPGMSGLELGRRVRASQRGAATCLIALTGYSQEGDCEAIDDAGFDHRLVKPLDMVELARILSGALEKADA